MPGNLVSIHVPARGTTSRFYVRSLNSKVSIHVPARGTTAGVPSFMEFLTLFQSTFPRGERLELLPSRLLSYCFNPRSREGNDLYPAPPSLFSISFQSTFPRGERHRPDQELLPRPPGFNPRSREGNDCAKPSKFRTFKGVSIHVPARGTTGV